jgi:hypothetical protein
MLEPTCDMDETPVQLSALRKRDETEVPLSSLTAVVESGDCWQHPGGTYMPSVKLTVRLIFATGEEVVTSAETPSVSPGGPEPPAAPYSFGDATVPEQPVLLSSSNFVQVG